MNEHGYRGMFKGLVPTLARDMPSWAIFIWSYSALKESFGVNNVQGQFLCGGAAGIACWAVVYPIDVIKTKVQMARAGVTMRQIVLANYYRSGVRFFFRGFGPSMARVALMNGIALTMIDHLKQDR